MKCTLNYLVKGHSVSKLTLKLLRKENSQIDIDIEMCVYIESCMDNKWRKMEKVEEKRRR